MAPSTTPVGGLTSAVPLADLETVVGTAGFIAVFALLAAYVPVSAALGLRSSARTFRTWRRRSARSDEIERGLAAIGSDEDGFDPASFVEDAGELVIDVHRAWERRDRDLLRFLLGDVLAGEWFHRLDNDERQDRHSRVKLRRRPRVAVVGVVNRPGDRDDRVVVFVRARGRWWIDTPEGPIPLPGHHMGRQTISQYWTLGRRRGRWVLESVEEEEEGRHHLTDSYVVTPDQDPRLADAARTELAAADATPPAARAVSLASTAFADDAHAAALDLALVDDRFSPDVLTAEVRETVLAWMRAVDGPAHDLERRATDNAVLDLLYGKYTTAIRTVVRGLEIEHIRIDRIDDTTTPARIEVDLEYRGHWYHQERDTGRIVEGTRDAPTTRHERWTFKLDDTGNAVWRLIKSDDLSTTNAPSRRTRVKRLIEMLTFR